MRVLVIVPTFNYTRQYPSFLSISDFPVGLAYIASSLNQAGFEVFGLNPNNSPSYSNAYQMLKAQVEQKIAEIQPDLICTGGLCTDYPFLKQVIELARRLSPSVPIVLGGGIITNDADFIFRTLKPDFCVRGEGEEVIVRLVKAIDEGGADFVSIPNIGYWKDGQARFTPLDLSYKDRNRRPWPEYEHFDVQTMLGEYSRASKYIYRYPRIDPRPMPIVAARGCPFSCSFCVHRTGVRYAARPVDDVIEEIKVMYEKYSFNILIIYDELFAATRGRVDEFSEAILSERDRSGWDFNWLFTTHASVKLDRETLQKAKAAGCYLFSCGLESASPTVLASMNKKTKPSQYINAIEMARRVKIGFGGNFIFGDVAETAETTLETLTFYHRYCRDMHISLVLLEPYPGSAVFDHCLENGLISDKLVYYEHINERLFNMTRLPNTIWSVWSVLLRILTTPSIISQATVAALACKEVSEFSDHPIAIFTQVKLYEIEAICPLCGEKMQFREMLPTGKARYSLPIKAELRERVIRSRWNFLWFTPLIRLLVSGLALLHPNFRGLLSLIGVKVPVYPSVVTGCPSCHGKIRIAVTYEQLVNGSAG